MPPVEDHVVHESVRKEADYKYGCHSRGEFSKGYFAPDRRYKPDGTFYVVQTRIINQMSKACRNFYLWDTDPHCAGCTANKDTEYRDRMEGLK